jgi:hypothetical protein
VTAAADTILLDRDRLRAAGVRGRHRRMTWTSWASPVRLAFRPRFVFVTVLVIVQTAVVAAGAGYVVVQVRQFRAEQRAHNCQTELNDQLRDPRAGLLSVCAPLTVGVKLQGPPVNRDTTTPTPTPGPVKTPMH